MDVEVYVYKETYLQCGKECEKVHNYGFYLHKATISTVV